MNTPDENPLLRDLLADEELDRLRRASLDQCLTAQRRARRYRQVRHAGIFALLPVLVFLGFLWHRPQPVPAAQPVIAAMPSPASPGVQMISDEELFALFPNRAVALIGQPGHQRLVLLGTQRGQ